MDKEVRENVALFIALPRARLPPPSARLLNVYP